MYSQAYARARCTVKPSPVRAQPSVIVGTEKVLAGSGWVPSERTLLLDGRVTNDLDAGRKGGRPKVHSDSGCFGLPRT